MSAAGRGEDREASDNYPTPSWCVRRLLEALDLPEGVWLEPCVGGGAIIRAVNEKRSDVEWVAQDIRDTEDELPSGPLTFSCGDFLAGSVAAASGARVVLTNPPFSHAMEFIKRARGVAPDAILAFLLRVNFLGSAERYEWLSRNMPDVYQLPNRPSFVKGKTDSTEYGWFVWKPGVGNRTTGYLHLLAQTSIEERRRG